MFDFSKLAPVFQQISSSAMQIGTMSLMFREARHSRCHGGMGMMGGMNMMGGMGMMGMGGMNSMQSIFMGMQSGYPLMNSFMNLGMNDYTQGYMNFSGYGNNNTSSYIANQSYNQGCLDAMQALQSVKNSSSQQVAKNPAAEAVDKDVDTTAGADFDKNIEKINRTDGTGIDYTISSASTASQYRSDLTALGKSYLRHIDKKSGDGDGYVTKEEFIKFNSLDSVVDSSSAMPEIENMFNAIDINGDGKIDYKEMASMFNAMDYSDNNTGKLYDGVIQSKDLNAAFEDMGTNGSSGTMFQKIARGWQQLFGNKDS